VPLEPLEVEVLGACSSVDGTGELVDQQCRGLSPEDAPSGAGQIDPEPEIDGVVVDEACGAIEDRLPAGIDGELLVRLRRGAKRPCEVVSRRPAPGDGSERGLGEPALRDRNQSPKP
jgi:hypothetical protein